MANINWSLHEQYVRTHIGRISNRQIANTLGVRLYDLEQFIHRERIFIVRTEPKNLAYEIIKMKFVHPEYFRPIRRFYRAIGMSQRQWWAAYRGERQLTEAEYMKVAEHLGLTLPEAYELRQIKMNFK